MYGEFFPLYRLPAILSLLTLGSLGFIVTECLHYKIPSFKKSKKGDFIFETIMHVALLIVYMGSALAYIASIIHYRWFKKIADRHVKFSCIQCSICSIPVFLAIFSVLLMGLFAVIIPVLGYYRDHSKAMTISSEDNVTVESVTTVIIVCHSIAKGSLLLNVFFTCSSAMCIFFSAANKWNSSCKKYITSRDAKVGDPKSWANNSPTKSDIPSQVEYSSTKSDIPSQVEYSFYYFRNHYVRVGRKTKLEREVLKRWFVLHYFVYLIEILLAVVYLLKPWIVQNDDINEETHYDNHSYANIRAYEETHDWLSLVYYLFALLVPYTMGIWLNSIHHRYHKEVVKVFNTYEYKRNKTDERIKSKPGFYHKKCIADKNATSKKCNKKYRKYFLLAMEKNMDLITDFDFVPSFFGISLPLEAQGYTFAVMITIVSIIFNFTAT